MAGISIDHLNEAELISLNRQIIERLRLLQANKAQDALASIHIGDLVSFEGPNGAVITGVVIRRNRKSVTVHDDRDIPWNVSPQLLKVIRSFDALYPGRDGKKTKAVSKPGLPVVIPFVKKQT